MLKKLVTLDVVDIIGQTLQEQGWFIDERTGKYSCEGRVFHNPDKPWIYVNPEPGTPCSVYQVIVDKCNFIPKHCLSCWKVVVKPRTLYELMRVLKLQEDWTQGYLGKGRFCKCGIELRTWVPQLYGAYFYTRSKGQGLARWEEVRKMVDAINPNIPVILKRYCTEFELRLGPSDQYRPPAHAEALEREIWGALDIEPLVRTVSLQPAYLRGHVIRKWIEWAWSAGDETAMAFNDGEPLYTPSVTYHPGDGSGDKAETKGKGATDGKS